MILTVEDIRSPKKALREGYPRKRRMIKPKITFG
jgi:hypothetical protein